MFLMPNEVWAAILGAIVGAWITYRFAVTLTDRQFQHLQVISKLDAQHMAAREFMSAFAAEIAALESGAEGTGDVMDYLRMAFPVQSKAVALFEQFVPDHKLQGFRTEWKNHCYGENGVDWPAGESETGLGHENALYLHYSTAMNPANRASASVRATQRIKALLTYAKVGLEEVR